MVSLSFRDFWQHLSSALVDELDQLTATIQAKWYKQHTNAGGHTAITATSLDASGHLSCERLILPVSQSVALTPVRIETSGPMADYRFYDYVQDAGTATFLELQPDGTDTMWLRWLDRRNRQPGEIVILKSAWDRGLTHFGFGLVSNVSTTPPTDTATPFLWLGAGTTTNIECGPWEVGASIILRLEFCQPTNTSKPSWYWKVLGRIESYI